MSDAEELQDVYSKTRAQRKLSKRYSREELSQVVNAIRYARLIDNTPIAQLAETYGININVVHRIGTGHAFKGVPFDERMRIAVDRIREAAGE